MPHSIRLRGPWQVEPLGRATAAADGSWRLTAEDLPPACTANMPADWGDALGDDFRGLVRHSRKFHRPTGLDANSRVWLVIENVDFQAAARLNAQPLGLVQLAGSPAQSLSLWERVASETSRARVFEFAQDGRSAFPSPNHPHPNSLPKGEGTGSSDAPIVCPARFNITALLAEDNQLALDILLPPDSASLPRSHRLNLPGGLIGLVRLEME